MKYLSFTFKGESYIVNRQGHIKANNLPDFSPNWIFLGGSRRFNSRFIDIPLEDAFEDPTLLNGSYGWDNDHGTVRQWGGKWNGKTPQIYGACLTDKA